MAGGATRRKPQEGFHPDLICGPVLGQNMNPPILRQDALDFPLQRGRRHRFRYTHGCCPVTHHRLRTRPDHVRHRCVVAEENVPALLDIQYRGKTGRVQSPVVQERAVLTKGIHVLLVIHRALFVAQKQREPGFQVAGKTDSAISVGARARHDGMRGVNKACQSARRRRSQVGNRSERCTLFRGSNNKMDGHVFFGQTADSGLGNASRGMRRTSNGRAYSD